MSSKRLPPTSEFSIKYFSFTSKERDIVKSCIERIENGEPPVEECPETLRRNVLHNGCRVFFRNDQLLDFEFI